MNILIVTEYVRRFPWSAARWSADLGAALRHRGNQVRVACDGLEDPSFFGDSPVIVRRPRRTWRGSDPLGFQSWALDLARTGGFDATISLTPFVPGDLWAPVTHGAAALVGHLVRTHSPVSAAMELAARPWLPFGVLAEARARATSMSSDGRRAIIARLGRLSTHGSAVPLGFASRLTPMSDDAKRSARAALRELLGLSHERPAILLSAVHPNRPGLGAFLKGFALARAELRDHGPVLMVMGRRTLPVHDAALGAGCARFVRFLGGTARPELAFAAADLAVSPWSGAGEINTGRFIADSLRLSVPILAHPRSPGADLVRPEHFGTPELGTIVADPTPEGWCRAMVEYLSLERWAYATRAARDAGAVLSMDGMAGRVEQTLRRAAGM